MGFLSFKGIFFTKFYYPIVNYQLWCYNLRQNFNEQGVQGLSIVIDIPFIQLRGRDWQEMERDELQGVFSKACDELLKPHGLAVRTTFVRNPMGEGEKWFMVVYFVDIGTGRKGALLRELAFLFHNERNIEDKASWTPARKVGAKIAPTAMTFTFTYGKLNRINAGLLYLRADFGSEISLENRGGKRGVIV